MPKYEEQSAQFKEKFQINYDIRGAYEFHRLTDRIKSFAMEGMSKNPAADLYEKTLTEALSVYLERVSSIGAGKEYAFVDVSIGEFIDEFEKVMQAKYLDEKEADPSLPERKPFEGEEYNNVALRVWNNVKRFDQPTPDVWASSILRGELTLDQIKAVTEPAKERLVAAENSSWIDNPEEERSVASAAANVMMAKAALDKASANRPFKEYLNPLNWIPFIRQAWYSWRLEKKVTHYHNRAFLDGDAEETLFGKSLIKGASKKLMEHIKNHPNSNPETLKRLAENEKNRRLAAEQKRLKEILEKGLSYEEVRDRMEDPALDESVDRQIKSIVEKPMGGDRSRITSMLVSTKNDMRTIIRKCWEAYGNAKDAEKKEAVVKSYAVAAFKRTYDHLKNNESLPSVDRIVVAQKIANVMMKTFSPVAFGETYAKYGDNYVVKNYDVKAIKEATGAYDIEDDLKDIKIELGIEKQPMQLDDDFKEKDVGKAERIEENAPVKDVQKDMQ